jgi:putative transposase
LGITLECIAPAKPQQNGRLERFHRTLKLEVSPEASLRPQQRAFDVFRGVYNVERPHSALDMAPPWTIYRRSRQRYPRPLLRTEASFGHLERVDRRGLLRWRRNQVLIGEAFAGEQVSLWPGDGAVWDVHFGAVLIGRLDDRTKRGFVPTRRAKGSMQLAFLVDEGWSPLDESSKRRK